MCLQDAGSDCEWLHTWEYAENSSSAQETSGESPAPPYAHLFWICIPCWVISCSWGSTSPQEGREEQKVQGAVGLGREEQPCGYHPGACPWSLAIAPWSLAVVGLEEPLVGAEPHGSVRVQQQLGEARGEVLDKAIRDRAQGCPDVGWQLMVVVFLQEREQGEQGGWVLEMGGAGVVIPCSSWPAAGPALSPPCRFGTSSGLGRRGIMLRGRMWLSKELPRPPWC